MGYVSLPNKSKTFFSLSSYDILDRIKTCRRPQMFYTFVTERCLIPDRDLSDRATPTKKTENIITTIKIFTTVWWEGRSGALQSSRAKRKEEFVLTSSKPRLSRPTIGDNRPRVRTKQKEKRMNSIFGEICKRSVSRPSHGIEFDLHWSRISRGAHWESVSDEPDPT